RAFVDYLDEKLDNARYEEPGCPERGAKHTQTQISI
ncbi:LysR family transcriptional regulator, partial [Burkholderia pseudomallei]